MMEDESGIAGRSTHGTTTRYFLAGLLVIAALFAWRGLPGKSGAPLSAVGVLASTPGMASPSAVPDLPPLPPGPVAGRVGIQIGHWRSAELPDELAALRTQTGASSAGYREVDVNLAVGQALAALLTARGVTVDLLPATVPPGYRADAFIALHCDTNGDPAMRGFKLARFQDSHDPGRDNALAVALDQRYRRATGQPRDYHITRDMLYYYAFNAKAFTHAIDPATPAVILELGFLSNPTDRDLLVHRQELVAYGLADGILRYLGAPPAR